MRPSWESGEVPVRGTEPSRNSIKENKRMSEVVKSRPEIASVMSGPYIGADPEIFVVNGDGVIIPAFTFLGDQAKKVSQENEKLDYYTRGRTPVTPTDLHSKYYSLHNDGFQAEFTVAHDTCLSYMVDHIQYGLQALFLAARKVDPKASLVADPVIEIPEELLLAAPAKYLQMGCAPSNNVYGIHGEAIADGKALGIRFAGSHIHMGLPTIASRKTPNIERIVMAMDCIAGVMSVALFGSKNERLRRNYYGLPGEFRLPKHGIEYRAISAAMLRHPVYYHLLVDAARFAMRMGDQDLMKDWWSTPIESVVSCMQHGTKKHAREIIAREPVFEAFLNKRYGYSKTKLLNILLGKAKIRDEGFLANWRIQEKPTFDNPNRWIAHCNFANGDAANVEVV